ncbi:hypothetical protein [Jiangella alba]|uniref:Uncharacterized protein n=1 Tax=Jiangella alba TaxID=561176 RepID=A0A1H5MNU6_9ACTN|nr:hypothetical protein [Jiangella alba]SEE90893.1 hypothetical protein SAMN04488561_3301 [Jiangella alba]
MTTATASAPTTATYSAADLNAQSAAERHDPHALSLPKGNDDSPKPTPRKRAAKKTTAKKATPAKKAPAKATSVRKTSPAKPTKATGPQRVQAPDAVAQDISRRLLAARAAGIPRPVLAQECGYTQSVVWRGEQGRALASEVEAFTRMLDRIDAGKITPPERKRGRPSQLVELKAAVDSAVELIEKARATKTATQRNQQLDQALALLTRTN